MNKRWKVEQCSDWLNGTYWIAWQPAKGWKSLAPKFHTHKEALHYADTAARTIRATLPRTLKPETRGSITWGTDLRHTRGSVALYDTVNNATITLARNELEDIALHLLAINKKDNK